MAASTRMLNLEGKVSAGRTLRFSEADGLAKLLEWGRGLDLSSYMYSDYESWDKLVRSEPYRQVNSALHDVDRAIMPEVASEIMKRQGVVDIYSIGPTAAADKVMLEKLVENKRFVIYHTIDVNAGVINSSLAEIRQHLSSRFGDSWKDIVILSNSAPACVADIKSAGPACVIYSSGTIMNNRNFWHDAARLAQVGGIVVASAALNPTLDEKALSEYWLSVYDSKEAVQLFERLLEHALPELFTAENRKKWNVALEYVTSPNKLTGQCSTPRISAQLRVKELMSITLNGERLMSLPTRTWAEQNAWNDYGSSIRKEFDSSPQVRAAIERAYAALDKGASQEEFLSMLPSECRRMPPIELACSAKHNPAEFLLTLPEKFGMDGVAYVQQGIRYKQNGLQGLAMSAVFSVDRPNSEMIFMKEAGPFRPLPPNYLYNPSIPSSLRENS